MSTDTIDLPQTSPRLSSPPPVPKLHISSSLSPTASNASATGASSGVSLNVGPGDDDDAAAAAAATTTTTTVAAATARRIRPGTKATDMATNFPLIPLSQLDSPFQLQEYLKALYQSYTHPKDADTVSPITRDIAVRLARPPEGAEHLLWLYELCRLLTVRINNLINAFFSQSPPCSTNTCPEMRAAEWQYLCAVHEPPKSCCAIDYCCHTLDWATNILTSPKYFPSRLTMGSEHSGGKQLSMRHLTNIFRRVYRIFAHAWFQHREAFWEVESNEGLYILFKTVCDVYSLIPEDNYTIPSEALGVKPPSPPPPANEGQGRRLTILRKIAKRNDRASPERRDLKPLDIAATARRHRQSPSRGTSVGTIVEASEDDEMNKDSPSSARARAERILGSLGIAPRGPREPSPFSQSRDRPASRSQGEKGHMSQSTTVRIAIHPETPVDRGSKNKFTAGKDDVSSKQHLVDPLEPLEVQDQSEEKPLPSEPPEGYSQSSLTKETTSENIINESNKSAKSLIPSDSASDSDASKKEEVGNMSVMPQFLPETLP